MKIKNKENKERTGKLQQDQLLREEKSTLERRIRDGEFEQEGLKH